MTGLTSHIAVCLDLARAISSTRTVEDIYLVALNALSGALETDRASILLFDADRVMRFKAYRGLSDAYRAAVEGHSPWTPDTTDAEPIVVSDVTADPSLVSLLPTFATEDIKAVVFVPLISHGRVIGKFMLYYRSPRSLSDAEIQLTTLIASHVAFAVERTRAETLARKSEERLRFALDAASMGTWDWDIRRGTVQWSDNLERLHGLPAGTFDGSFDSYQREVHPEDRDRVREALQRALAEGVPFDTEYRIVAPDGTVRWVEGKGVIDYEDGQPAHMAGVCIMTTRRKEAELARLASAEEANHLKDEFLATLSHELRTPLNAILGWVQVLEAVEPTPERVTRAIDIIGRNARQQAQLIEDILDVSRIITGKLSIERHPVNLSHVLDTIVTSAAPAAVSKNVRLQRIASGRLPSISGDSRRIQQVLGNVLNNAIKFTPEGGDVEIRCEDLGGTIEVRVRDTGAGIAPEFLPYIFDRFRQADSRSTRKHGGLGLGLAIARHLLEQHGGQIRAESDGPGAGTTMVIRLPAGGSPRVEAPIRDLVREKEPGDDPCADIRLDGVPVLVVDDQRDSRELFGALLERCGASVAVCESVTSALAHIRDISVDLIIADIAMPELDGYDLIQRVRQQREDVAAVAVSAYARPEDRRKALESGYDAFCPKPVDAAFFLHTIYSVMIAKGLTPDA